MKYLIWLVETAKIPPQKSHRLLSVLGDSEAVWRATAEQAGNIVQLTPEENRTFSDKGLREAEGILGRCKAMGVRVIGIFDNEYPDRLKNIYDPPTVLYLLGKLPDFDKIPSISIVGHRNATPYGIMAAEKLGQKLSESGFIVVSGMAKGIDGAAHRGALKGLVPTVAVFGTAIDQCYPAENVYLFHQILQRGAILSEYPPGKKGQAYYFPRRNRIISGLTLGTVVVEAGRKSGSLITANLALDQGRDVFAVPGSINASSSEGANDLIKKGAKLISDAYDVIIEYSGLYEGYFRALAARQEEIKSSRVMTRPQNIQPSQPAQQSKPQKQTLSAVFGDKAISSTGDIVLDAITVKTHIDRLIETLNLPEGELMARLTILEIEGKIRQLAGKYFERI